MSAFRPCSGHTTLIQMTSAGFAGAFIDRETETRGMDFIDKEKAKVRYLCSVQIVVLTTVLLSVMPDSRSTT